VAFSLACGSGDNRPSSPDSTPTPGSIPTPADASSIRQVDFNQNPDLQRMLSAAGSGSIERATIVYADVTGDLREEAIVPIASGGTLGNIAYLVFGRSPSTKDGATLLLTRTADRSSAGGLRMSVENGRLIETAAEYGASDALCCPSVLRRTIFRWDGAKLQVEREEKVPNTTGQKQ
jgi:hypothetical protein